MPSSRTNLEREVSGSALSLVLGPLLPSCLLPYLGWQPIRLLLSFRRWKNPGSAFSTLFLLKTFARRTFSSNIFFSPACLTSCLHTLPLHPYVIHMRQVELLSAEAQTHHNYPVVLKALAFETRLVFHSLFFPVPIRHQLWANTAEVFKEFQLFSLLKAECSQMAEVETFFSRLGSFLSSENSQGHLLLCGQRLLLCSRLR